MNKCKIDLTRYSMNLFWEVLFIKYNIHVRWQKVYANFWDSNSSTEIEYFKVNCKLQIEIWNKIVKPIYGKLTNLCQTVFPDLTKILLYYKDGFFFQEHFSFIDTFVVASLTPFPISSSYIFKSVFVHFWGFYFYLWDILKNRELLGNRK